MSKELRVVLLGKTGAGKSSTGNTLLGRDAFRVARGLRSGTERCQWADEERDGLRLEVTDTPGLCDTHREEEDVLKEIGKSVAVARPGPHVILMVLRCDTRFTEEEFGAYLVLKAMFGDDIKKHMIVVFVGVDAYAEAFGDTIEEQRKGLDKEMREATGHIQTVLQDASNRYIGVNNKASKEERQRQAHGLIEMMKELTQRNGGQYFSSSISEEISQLVKPLVERRMNDGSSREQAERETNIAIVQEKEKPDFFSKVSEIIKNKIMPILENADEIIKTVKGIAVTVGPILPVIKKCSVM